ncbi:adhesin biosynthesis transcription regulatory protein [Pseudomonas duriflava]|uniref:Adhesin biosynthesis transcription regulatory protein n=1 Tax=Pseudomonas duriflava TaxID=459528 RepID=A0A562Q7A2_9PSED|nr:PapB/FocB family fimbrial expression transcriptional regulator [Pseudomonas duriflava]TWI52588.1 adhesin biosynthesis transcription regulatory protein [Pseudomonas duriflava]
MRARTLSFLKPGTLEREHFDLLLEGTSIRGERIIRALEDFLIKGIAATEACEANAVSRSQFYRRLYVLESESERARRLSKFYSYTD